MVCCVSLYRQRCKCSSMTSRGDKADDFDRIRPLVLFQHNSEYRQSLDFPPPLAARPLSCGEEAVNSGRQGCAGHRNVATLSPLDDTGGQQKAALRGAYSNCFAGTVGSWSDLGDSGLRKTFLHGSRNSGQRGRMITAPHELFIHTSVIKSQWLQRDWR